MGYVPLIIIATSARGDHRTVLVDILQEARDILGRTNIRIRVLGSGFYSIGDKLERETNQYQLRSFYKSYKTL